MAMNATETMNIPSGGLASFLDSNLDEIDDRILAFGRDGGINSMQDVANRMAQMGRGGDSYIVHASEREMMVPREVVENNPELRNQIMESIAAEGADPEAYIVGSEANSINPMTGQREFFLKKLVRGVKKVVKGVVNVVKKVAPVVLPFALNAVFPGMGTIASGALGAGLGSLIQGKSFKDSLKAAALGGALGGISSGIGSVMRGGTFMQGISQGLTGAPGVGFFEPSEGVRNFFGGAGAQGPSITASTRGAAPAAGGEGQTWWQRTFGGGAEAAAPAGDVATGAAAEGAERTLGQRALDFIRPTPAATPEALMDQAYALTEQYPGLGMPEALDLVQRSQPSTLSRFIRPALTLGAVATAAGAFNPPEQEELIMPGYESTSSELLSANPEQYRVGVPDAPVYVGVNDIRVPTGQRSPYAIPPIEFPAVEMPPLFPTQYAAQGGEMQSFPRRMGAIDGPGTETSDDVPAMLSDGEFVMTARAVRGAGNGSRKEGVRRMYDLMRMFEGGVAR